MKEIVLVLLLIFLIISVLMGYTIEQVTPLATIILIQLDNKKGGNKFLN